MTKTTKTETRKSAGSYALIAAVLCALSGMPAQAQQNTPPPVVAEPPVAAQEPSREQGALQKPAPAKREGIPLLKDIPIIGNLFQAGKQKDAPAVVMLDVGDAWGNPRQTLVTQKMADRTRRIMVLRQLLTLGFTQADIETALPLLRRLHDLKSPKPMDPEKAMDEEYQALLKAGPKDPLPPNSALKIMDASRYYQEEQTKIWAEMAQRLGKTKSEGLFHLLRQDGNVFHYTVPVASGKDTYTVEQHYSATFTDPRNRIVASRRLDPPTTVKRVDQTKSTQAVPPATEKPVETKPVPVDPATKSGGEDTHQADEKPVPPVATVKTPTELNYSTTNIILSSLTTHISLTDLIDLLQEKLKAMSGASTAR